MLVSESCQAARAATGRMLKLIRRVKTLRPP
jgi:hypothetical protein